MKTKMKTMALAMMLAVGTLGVSGSAQAVPMLNIGTSNVSEQEVIGDAGGSLVPGNNQAGPGLPSVNGGWPMGPGFVADPSFNNAVGMSGFDASYLSLTEGAFLRFQFMGAGNSALMNTFLVNNSAIFFDKNGGSGQTAPCTVPSGSTIVCGAQSEYVAWFAPGLVSFQFLTGENVLLNNTGAGLGNPGDNSEFAGYMLGVDPYLANSPFETSGTAVYAALSDMKRTEREHDYSDMGVRISVVPEPGSLALLGLALTGLAFSSRRKSV